MIQAAPSYDSFVTKFTTTETVITFLLTSPIYLILSQIQWEMEQSLLLITHVDISTDDWQIDSIIVQIVPFAS